MQAKDGLYAVKVFIMGNYKNLWLYSYPTVVNVIVMKHTASVNDQFSTTLVYMVIPKQK